MSQEFEDASQKLQDYCECLGIEVNERINILDMLKECKTSYTYHYTETKHAASVRHTLTHPYNVPQGRGRCGCLDSMSVYVLVWMGFT